MIDAFGVEVSKRDGRKRRTAALVGGIGGSAAAAGIAPTIPLDIERSRVHTALSNAELGRVFRTDGMEGDIRAGFHHGAQAVKYGRRAKGKIALTAAGLGGGGAAIAYGLKRRKK